MICKFKIIFLLLFNMANGQLIRSVDVYRKVIEEICDYYQCFSITLFSSEPPDTQDIYVMTQLMKLTMYFEHELLIQTTVTDIPSFASQFSSTRFELMVKPLFILLNDSEDMKVQFTETLVPLLSLSKPMWLIFMQDETSIDGFFEDVFIPFNCKFMASRRSSSDIGDSDEVIVEIYRVYYGRPLKKDFFATWNITTGMHLPSLALNMRRKNLDSQLLRVNSMSRPPGSIIITNEKDNTSQLAGFCGEFLLDLQNSLNFRVAFKETARGGNCFPNGTCTYGIELMRKNQSDLLALDMALTTSRVYEVQYLSPLYLSNLYIYISKPRETLQWSKYISPFSNGIWFIIAVMIIIIGSLVTLIKFMSKMDIIDEYDPSNTNEKISFIDSYFIILAALCGQAMKRSQINSLRFVEFTVHATSIILLASYSAILISLLAVNFSGVPFISVDSLLDDGSYSIGVMNTSAEYNIIETADNILMTRLFREVNKIRSSLPTSRSEGFQRVCDDNKFAFIANQNAYLHFDAENCYLIQLENLIDLSTAFSVPQSSPFIEIFNYQINLLREAGVLRKIFNDGESKMLIEDSWSPVALFEIFPLLALLICSFIISIIILITEKIHYLISINRKQSKGIPDRLEDKQLTGYNIKFRKALN